MGNEGIIDRNCGGIDNGYWTRSADCFTLKLIDGVREQMKNQLASIRSPEPLVDHLQTEPRSVFAESRKPVKRVMDIEPLLTAEDVAKRLNVSTDWVWDHSSRKKPLLPVIRMGDGALRYRASGIEEFIDERERLSALRRRA